MLEESQKSAVQKRLKRASGQVTGIQKMIEEDRYCVDVLTQISAVRAALAKVSKIMLETHIQTCVKTAFETDDLERKAKMVELVKIFEQNCNC